MLFLGTVNHFNYIRVKQSNNDKNHFYSQFFKLLTQVEHTHTHTHTHTHIYIYMKYKKNKLIAERGEDIKSQMIRQNKRKQKNGIQ